MDMKKIGRFIAEKRKEKHMTQVQLAEKLGVTNKTVSRWENGNYMPDLSMLIPLSEVLEVSVNDLLNGQSTMPENDIKGTENAVVNSLQSYEKMAKESKKELLQNVALVSVIVAAFAVTMGSVIYNGYVGALKYHIQSQGGGIMSEMFMYIVWGTIIIGVLAIVEFAFAIYHKWNDKRMNHLQGMTSGTVTGLVRSHLFKNDVVGEVPGGTLIGWGVAQGEQYWGGMLKMRIPPWFPCVKYEVNGKEYHKITGEGTWKDTWGIGQNVTILYKPEAPDICFVEGDTSNQTKAKMCMILGTIFTVICIVGIVVLVMFGN